MEMKQAKILDFEECVKQNEVFLKERLENGINDWLLNKNMGYFESLYMATFTKKLCMRGINGSNIGGVKF
jgi:hypothetical protein